MIVIIGAGIGGLTAAIALRRAGQQVEVFERADELREVGAGIALWRNALRAMETIGLADTIRPFSVPHLNAGLRRWDGKAIVTPSATGQALGELGLVIHRATLQAVLADAAGRDTIRLGKTCSGVEQDDAGATAHFTDGTQARGMAVIGADGLHSVVRAVLHGGAAPTYSGYTSWRSVVRFDHARLTTGESWGPGTRFGQVPMANGDVYWFAARNASPGQRAAGGEKAEMRRVFTGWHAPIEALIECAYEGGILRNDIFDRPVLSRWGKGRVTLLGDAAHPMTPNLGQGACQAIEDAVALARAFADTADVARALQSYEKARIQRANRIVTLSRRIGQMAQWENRVAIGVRNGFIKHVGSRLQVQQMRQVLGE